MWVLHISLGTADQQRLLHQFFSNELHLGCEHGSLRYFHNSMYDLKHAVKIRPMSSFEAATLIQSALVPTPPSDHHILYFIYSSQLPLPYPVHSITKNHTNTPPHFSAPNRVSKLHQSSSTTPPRDSNPPIPSQGSFGNSEKMRVPTA